MRFSCPVSDPLLESHEVLKLIVTHLGWNVMVDVVLAVLPVTIFYKLNLRLKKKLGLSALLGLGLVAAICGAIKTKFLAGLSARSDLTWETYNLFVLSSAELFVIIVCGSIPPIKPLYDMVFRSDRQRTGYSYSNSANRYIEEHSLKNNSRSRPLESGDRHLVGSSSDDEERGVVGVGVGEKGRKMMPRAGGITKVTDIMVTHGRQT